MRSQTFGAIITTYGTRSHFANRSVAGALSAGASRVVPVANGSSLAVLDGLRELAARDERVVLIERISNGGSAAAIREATTYILTADWKLDYVILLDDDNLLPSGGVERISKFYATHMLPEHACLAVRRTLEVSARVLEDDQVPRHPPRSSYQGFDVIQYMTKKFGIRHRVRPQGPQSVAYAPYGGLVLPIDELARAHALPHPDYILYEDDTDLTFRVGATGGSIYRCDALSIADMDPKWYEESNTRVTQLLKAPLDFRLYYAVRNRAFFDKHVYRKSALRYHTNKSIFLLCLFFEASRLGRKQELTFVREALIEGSQGVLGLNPRFPLPA